MKGEYARVVRWFASALVAASFTLSPGALADVPDTITFQGYVTDSGGTPLAGPQTVTFRLYDAPTGGELVWTEVYDNVLPGQPDSQVVVIGGLFSVRLGSVTPFRGENTSDALTFGEPYYLSIEVNSDGEMVPRTELTGTPYAFNVPQLIETIAYCDDPDPGNHDSLQAIVDGSSSVGLLLINIQGMCEQNVRIRRDRVILRGINLNDGGAAIWPDPPNGIIGQASDTGAIQVDGASDVIVLNLHIDSAGGLTGDSGVEVRENGAVYIGQSKFTNARTAVNGYMGGFAFVDESDVRGDSYGFLVTDAAHGRVQDSVIRVDNSDDSDSGTVAGFRADSIRIRGDNEILNHGDNGIDESASGGGDDGLALNVGQGTTVRQDGGHTKFVGNLSGGNELHVSLRDPEIHGDIDLGNSSTMDVRKSSLPGDTFFGTYIEVGSGSELSFTRPNMTGTIDAINVWRGSFSTSTDFDVTIAGNVSATGPGRFSIGDNSDISMPAGSIDLGNRVDGWLGNGATLELDAGGINVHGRSKLDLGDNAVVTIDVGDLTVQGSRVSANTGAKFDVGGAVNSWRRGNVTLAGSGATSTVGASVAANDDTLFVVATGSTVSVGADVNVSQGSTLRVEGGGTLGIGEDLEGYNRPNISLQWNGASGATVNVQGSTFINNFGQLEFNDEASFTSVGNVHLSALSLWYTNGPDVVIDADVSVCHIARLGWYGDNLTYTGDVSFCSQPDRFDLGANATLDGDVFCNGIWVNATTMPTFLSGTFNDCAGVYLGTIDLAALAADNADPVAHPATITYTNGLQNTQPAFGFADNATMTIDFSSSTAGVSFVSATPDQGSCDASAFPVITCDLQQVPPNTTVDVVVAVDTTSTGTVTETVSVSADQADPNFFNDSTAESTTVN